MRQWRQRRQKLPGRLQREIPRAFGVEDEAEGIDPHPGRKEGIV
jgi:hypothetical protein